MCMSKRKHLTAKTPFAKLREDYNETHDKMITQTVMASMASVSKSTISRIESGEQPATPTVIKAYCDFFGVSSDYFVPEKKEEKIFPDDSTPVGEIGITKEVIATYKAIDEISNRDENILAVLNSLIGNQGATVCLLHNILGYLVNQETHNMNRVFEQQFTDELLNYINDFMKPQLKKVIKSNIDWQNQLPNDFLLTD